jgi:glycerophosphoryl diester phosphodiesterase
VNFFQRIGGERLLAAHRGARSARPENTMSAFEYALGRSDFLEVDVQYSP